MARGTTRLTLLNMLKAECGYNMQTGVATAQDAELNQLLDNTQQWLWSQYQWPFLYTHKDVTIVGLCRYYDFPSGISFDYPTIAESKWGNLWYPVSYGIKGEQYEVSDPERGRTLDPVSRWQIYSLTQFEVWPLPANTQMIRFWGTGTAPALSADNSVAVLDDLLIVYHAAAEKLARAKSSDAGEKMKKATALFNRLRGASRPNVVFTMGGGPTTRRSYRHSGNRVISVVGNPNR